MWKGKLATAVADEDDILNIREDFYDAQNGNVLSIHLSIHPANNGN